MSSPNRHYSEQAQQVYSASESSSCALRSQRQNRFATIARKENERCVCSPGPEPPVKQAMPSIARTSARSFLDCSLASLQSSTLDMRQARGQLADSPARERRFRKRNRVSGHRKSIPFNRRLSIAVSMSHSTIPGCSGRLRQQVDLAGWKKTTAAIQSIKCRSEGGIARPFIEVIGPKRNAVRLRRVILVPI